MTGTQVAATGSCLRPEGTGKGKWASVCAPAGYGKTILLADWVRRIRFPAAWLSLDAGDSDPARFWRHAVSFGAARSPR